MIIFLFNFGIYRFENLLLLISDLVLNNLLFDNEEEKNEDHDRDYEDYEDSEDDDYENRDSDYFEDNDGEEAESKGLCIMGF